MRIKLFSAWTVAALVTIGSAAVNTAQAQTTTGGNPRRAAMAERRKEMRERLQAMTPEQRRAALERAKARGEGRREARAARGADRSNSATPAQRTWAQSLRTETKAVREAVKAGTLTREAAAARLRAWRSSHPRPTSGN